MEPFYLFVLLVTGFNIIFFLGTKDNKDGPGIYRYGLL
jgi:hypothetical protein